MTLNQLKKQILITCLDLGLTRVLVAPNTQKVKVTLPAELMKRYGVMLNISRKFKGGLEILEHGFKAQLSFEGEPCDVEIPWEAIVRLTDSNDEEHSFMEIYALPGDTEMSGTTIEVTEDDSDKKPTPKPRGHLRVVH